MKNNFNFLIFTIMLLFFNNNKLYSNLNINLTSCVDAIQINQANLPNNQSLVCGTTNDINNNTVLGIQNYLGGLESIYKFTPTSSGNFNIAYAGQSWTGIFVFQGCPTSGGSNVGNITNSSSSKNLTVNLLSGVEYYIVFDTYPSPASPCSGTFTITAPPPPCVIPSAQPTSLTFSSISNSSISGSFTAAASAPSGYLVVRSTSATPPTPTDGTTYSSGSTSLGTGTSVVQTSSATSFTNSSLTGNTTYYYYIFSYNNTSCSGGPIYLSASPLSLSTTTCASAPSVSAATSISTTGFTANWSASTGGASSYLLYVATDSSFSNIVSGYNGIDVGSVTNYTVTGLTASTTYYYRLVAVGSSCNSSNSSTIIVSTSCEPETAPTQVQDFSTFTGAAPAPICWSEASGALTSSVTLSGTSSNWLNKSNGFANANSSNVGASINLYGSSTNWLISNEIDLGNTLGLYQLKYKYAVTSYNGTSSVSTLSSHKVDVVVSTDGGATWSNTNIIKSYAGSGTYSNTGAFETVLLSQYSGVVKIAFVATCISSSDIDFHIDDFQIELAPTCIPPTALSSSNISYQTATIGWTEPSSGTSPASYEYEVRTSGAAGSGATGLVTSGSTTSPTVSVNLTGLNGGTAYTYYVRSDCGGGDFSSWASATFTTLSCNVPTAVTSSAITTSTATIAWTAPATGSPTGYEYEVRTSGAAGSGSTGLIASGTTTAPTVSASLNALSAVTSYSVYVRTNCYSGFNSSWTSAVTFTTLCNPVTTLPFIESFETISSGIPTCWGIAGSLAPSSSYHFSSTSSGQTGRGLRFNSFSSSSGSTSELITPTLDLTSLSTAELKFWFKNPTGGNFEVLISTDNGANYTSLQSSLTGQTAWLQKSYTITSYISSTVKIKFKGTSNYGNGDAYVYLDEIMVQAIPSCLPVTSLTTSAITYQTATIGWTAPSSGTSPASYEYEVRTSGAAGSGATGLVTSGSTTSPTVSVNLTGLNGGTAYTYYVRSDCGGDFSSWASATFTTLSCNVPTAVTSSAIATTTATIAWTAPATGSPTGYEYEVRTSGNAGSGSTGLVASGTTTAPTVSASLSGLTASTSYSVYVRTNCYSGFNSAWTTAVTFSTLCNTFSVPYYENFESVTTPALPNCTSIENAGSGNNWKTAAPNSYGFTNKCLNYSYNFSNAANAWFYTGPISLTAGTSYRISYNYGSSSTGSYPEKLKVAYGVSPSSANMTTVLATHTNILTNSAPLNTVDFTPSTTGVYYFGFNAFSVANMDQLYVDNISIILTPNTWTGTTSNSWNTASNWSANAVPTATDDVLISSDGSNAPMLDVDVTIPAGKSLILNGSGTLTIAPGKVLTIAGTANFGGMPVTFKSDATGSGMFGPLTGTLTGATNVKVERYIPARRAFRFVTSSVTTSGSIFENWQENGGTTAGLGTHITGTGGATDGFDVTATNNPSMFGFNHNTGQWAAVTNTNVNTLTAGTPYRLMVRGDRNTDLTTNTPASSVTTLRATGSLKTGDFTPALNQAAEGFSFIGNPYQAPLDMEAVLTNSATNMNTDVLYYWDPTLNTRGAYVTRTLSANSNTVTSDFTEILQPGQAVFVKKDNTATAATMTISETHKNVASGAAGVFRTNANNTQSNAIGLLRANLQASIDNEWQTTDAALALFDSSYTWDVTQEDATKMNNLDEEVSFVQNNTSLAIAKQNDASVTDELPIRLQQLRHTDYRWVFDLTNYNGNTPYLLDTEQNTLNVIENGAVFPFTAGSNATNRFKIVFQNSTLSTDDFANNIKLYPNPTKSGASFYVAGIKEATVLVYNVVGQNIPVTVVSQGSAIQVTPTATLSQGIYLVSITTTDGKTAQVKWIVE